MRGPRALPVLAVAAAWSVVGVALSGLTRTLYTFLVARVEGEVVTGVVGAQLALAAFATMLWPAATGQAASKFVARAQGLRDEGLAASVTRHLRGRTLLTGSIAAVLAVAAAVLVLHEPVSSALAVAPLVLGYAAYLLTRGVLLGSGRVAEATRRELVALVLSLGVLAVLLAVGATPWLVLPLALGYVVYAVLGARRRPGTPRPAPVEPALRREMDAFVAWGVLGNVASAGLLQLSLVVAGATQRDADVGQLTAAVALATPASMIARSLVQVLFPAMARSLAAGDRETVRRQTDLVTRGIVAAFVPLFGVLVLGSGLLIRVYGEDFRDPTALRILLVAVLLTTLPVAAVASMTSGGADGIRRSALMSLAGFVLGLVGMAALTSGAGIVGIAVAYLAGAFLTSLLPWVWVWRTQEQRWGGLSLRVLLAVAVLVTVLVVQDDLPGGPVLAPVLLGVVLLGVWGAASARDLRAVLRNRSAPGDVRAP
ncbi:lipopolysaccharide biosynthesis protein [Kineococcus gynurae]|uniref:Lipopolysaccharide biosynthesis protein n=1 Tax=Kineococcus gynurae TaxID=452979 RepID=A0ABV5LRI5_9ACTN